MEIGEMSDAILYRLFRCKLSLTNLSRIETNKSFHNLFSRVSSKIGLMGGVMWLILQFAPAYCKRLNDAVSCWAIQLVTFIRFSEVQSCV